MNLPFFSIKSKFISLTNFIWWVEANLIHDDPNWRPRVTKKQGITLRGPLDGVSSLRQAEMKKILVIREARDNPWEDPRSLKLTLNLNRRSQATKKWEVIAWELSDGPWSLRWVGPKKILAIWEARDNLWQDPQSSKPAPNMSWIPWATKKRWITPWGPLESPSYLRWVESKKSWPSEK